VISNDTLHFAGEADLTDYHAPLGPGAAAALGEALTTAGAAGYRFDSLPEDAAAVVGKALAEIGQVAEPQQHDVAAVLDLPSTVDEWMAALPKKERHEMRRKRRRLAAAVGEPALVRDTSASGMAVFTAMHRAAAGDKGRFLDEAMEIFFAALASNAGFVIDLLVVGDMPVATAFGYEDGDGYFLYNSAYDPALGNASPGVVLLGELIGAQIERGARVFDFMKGDEDYKFRMGAHRRDLYLFRGDLP
jgi:CelD/BcsL family acetyltransferase involved in cellulose biosynthesis